MEMARETKMKAEIKITEFQLLFQKIRSISASQGKSFTSIYDLSFIQSLCPTLMTRIKAATTLVSH